VRVEETDGRLTVAGTWSRASHVSFSAGAFVSSSQANATLSGTFRGTAFTLVGARGGRYGKFEVLIDGVSRGVVDCYAPAAAYSVPVFTRTSLVDGEHAFTIRVLGTKSTASSGSTVILDAIDITGEVLDRNAIDVTRFGTRNEEHDPRVNYVGLWGSSNVPDASGGKVRAASIVGSSAEASFEGTSAAWIGPRGPGYGRSEVLLDGVSQGFVDQYAAALAHKQSLWSVTGLAPGEHRIRIRAAGQKTAASTGTAIVIDALVLNKLRAPRYDESDGRTEVVGTWSKVSAASSSGGRYLSSASRDAHIVVRFNGTAVRWLGPTGPSFGRAEVHLDGRFIGTVDQYSASARSSAVIWAASGLADTGHALVIRVLGTARPGQSGAAVGFDCAETARGTLGAPAEWTTPGIGLEDYDARIGYAGAWRRGLAAGFSGGGYKYASSAGATLSTAFNGTAVTLLGAKGPAYGLLEVFVDGSSKGTVDCYSPTPAFGAALYSATGLASGVHVVTAKVLGSKSEESSGTLVAIDGVAVSGEPLRTMDERVSSVTRSSGWTAVAPPALIAGTGMSSTVAKATLTFRFIGSSVAVLAPRGPGYGKAEVLIDGRSRGVVDLYASKLQVQGSVFSLSGLVDGVHTVVVRVLGTKNAASSGTAVVVDGFAATGEKVSRRGTMVATARAQLNKQYVWAAGGPNQFDCSGLTSYAYRSGGISIPHQSGYQFRMCSPQSSTWTGLLPGDLVFTSSPTYIHHVGIYVGYGLTINAPGTGRFVEYRAASTYGCFGRIAAKYWPSGNNGL